MGDTPSILTNVVSATVSGTFATDGQYKWQSSLDGVSGWSDVSGANSSTFQPPSAPPPSIFYRRLVVNNGCYEASNSIQISINSLPTASITAVGLASANSSNASASICDGTMVDFNAAGGVEYEFFIDNISVQGRSASSNYSTNTLDDTDEVKVRAYDSSLATACFDESAFIKFDVTPNPVVTISSNINSNTFCAGSNVIFSAGAGGSASFTFFKNGIEVRGPSLLSTFTTNALSNNDIISVEGTINGCSGVASLTLSENAITTVGTITASGSTTICSGDTPAVINGDPGVVGGVRTYQWQSSLNGTDWSNIDTATGVLEDYTPDSPLTQTTSFRRKTISSVGTITCEGISNVVQISISTPPTAVLKGYQSTPPAGEVLATSSLTICVGASPQFYASGVGAVAYPVFAGGVSLELLQQLLRLQVPHYLEKILQLGHLMLLVVPLIQTQLRL